MIPKLKAGPNAARKTFDDSEPKLRRKTTRRTTRTTKKTRRKGGR